MLVCRWWSFGHHGRWSGLQRQHPEWVDWDGPLHRTSQTELQFHCNQGKHTSHFWPIPDPNTPLTGRVKSILQAYKAVVGRFYSQIVQMNLACTWLVPFSLCKHFFFFFFRLLRMKAVTMIVTCCPLWRLVVWPISTIFSTSGYLSTNAKRSTSGLEKSKTSVLWWVFRLTLINTVIGCMFKTHCCVDGFVWALFAWEDFGPVSACYNWHTLLDRAMVIQMLVDWRHLDCITS